MTINANEILVAERARIAAIVESPEGKRHPKSALKLALYSGMSADMAKDMLKDLPVESVFVEAMDREGATGLTSPLGGVAPGSPKEARLAELRQAGAANNYARGYITAEQAAARGLKIKAR